jgi:CheY-like chemotaxis protein
VTASETSPKALVLVVDDEPGIREFIGQVLTRAGHEFVAVATPSAALAALRSRPRITLMVVDVVMPDMDGYELATAARQMAPGLPVVFTSAFAPEPGRVTSGDRFLGKPFTAESLIAIIDESR